MPDIYAAQAVFTSLSSAFELSRAIKDVSDATKLNTIVMDLQSKILDAQAKAMQSQQQQQELLEQIENLTKQLEAAKRWSEDAGLYSLTQIQPGSLVYMKTEKPDGEPEVWLCVNCFENQVRSVLQRDAKSGIPRVSNYSCPSCKSMISLNSPRKPGYWRKEDIEAQS